MRTRSILNLCSISAMVLVLWPAVSVGQSSFVNWESPHVHPLALTPDGNTLVAVNTPDNRVELFDVSTGQPVPSGSISVGLDPVSVRVRPDAPHEVWVVNHISDSISVVDLSAGNVVATIATLDEPADVVFAGNPMRAFVSCSQANTILVFDPSNLASPPLEVPVIGEDPRMMAVSQDGTEVYVAIFESGNRTTILGGGSTMNGGFPPNVVSDPLGPYGGVNPPPNSGSGFDPLPRAGNPPPPPVGLIVRKDETAAWMDDNHGDWTDLVSGANADHSGRPQGWDLLDHDVAVIHTSSLAVDYASGMMNICMALAVHPTTNDLVAVGIDATNEIRFEPIVNGRFVRVQVAFADPTLSVPATVVDLNAHLDYTQSTIGQNDRDRSIGDPRGIVWRSDSDIAYVTGMGSNNVIVIDSTGARGGLQPTIEVGEGPTGLVLHESQNRLYVLNKFEASISYIDTTSETEIGRTAFFDPSPPAIKIGRKHLYDTHKNSGLGQVSCASCHVDGRMDRLSWDLGNPAGEVKAFNQNCTNGVVGGCQNWHPMKGPMTTQTLQDIIGKEPHHWRGDRNGLEEFSGAFISLLGDDATLTPGEMQEFEDFLATITFGPNAFRNFDNTLPANLPLPGHFTPGRFAPAGQPLPDGDAVNGLNLYRTAGLDGIDCVSCHTLPTGVGSNYALNGFQFNPIPPGPKGEMHHAVVAVDGSTNISMKTPQLRNLFDKVGFEQTQLMNTAGFGFLHDGSVDSIARFVSEPVFNVTSDQDIADLVAFMLSFSGSDLPIGSPADPTELPGPSSNDTHAGVGRQTTLVDEATADPGQLALIADMIGLADAGAVGLVVKGIRGGLQRGAYYAGGNQFQTDRQAELLAAATLRSLAAPGNELTYLLVPFGSEVRIGVDRDEDGFFDRDEIDGCSDPADSQSVPPQCGPIDVVAPIPAPSPHDILKNRYISIDPRGENGTNVGLDFDIRVTMTSTLVTGVTAIGARWWANAPDAKCIAVVGSTRPAVPPNWDACPTLHLAGCPIIPTSTYEIVGVEGITVSDPPLVAATQAKPGVKWHGDCVGFFDGAVWTPPNGVTSIDDAVAALKTFQDVNAFNATHVSVTDMEPNLNGSQINKIVNINDVFSIILGFQGLEYPGPQIELCPDS